MYQDNACDRDIAFGERDTEVRIQSYYSIATVSDHRMCRKNAPDVTVYNQCSNIILRYAIKTLEGHEMETSKNLYDKSPVSDPPRPGNVDCIVAGFPW